MHATGPAVLLRLNYVKQFAAKGIIPRMSFLIGLKSSTKYPKQAWEAQ
jgi:hypothetical protein